MDQPTFEGSKSMRENYEQGVDEYYQQHGAGYRNPHFPGIVAAVSHVLPVWYRQLSSTLDSSAAQDTSAHAHAPTITVLDLACGSGEASQAVDAWWSLQQGRPHTLPGSSPVINDHSLDQANSISTEPPSSTHPDLPAPDTEYDTSDSRAAPKPMQPANVSVDTATAGGALQQQQEHDQQDHQHSSGRSCDDIPKERPASQLTPDQATSASTSEPAPAPTPPLQAPPAPLTPAEHAAAGLLSLTIDGEPIPGLVTPSPGTPLIPPSLNLHINACDPYTQAAYRTWTGRTAEGFSFQDVADGAVYDRAYHLVVSSYALHVLDASKLFSTLMQLSLVSEHLLVLSPHKKPVIEVHMGWELQEHVVVERVHARLYRSTQNMRQQELQDLAAGQQGIVW